MIVSLPTARLRRIGLSLCAAALYLSLSQASAAAPQITQCELGEDENKADITLIFFDEPKAHPRDEIDLTIVPGFGEERPAVARLIQAHNSPFSDSHGRVIFLAGDDIGLVLDIARNGDARSTGYTISTDELYEDLHLLGSCDPVSELFGQWR